MDTAQEVNPVTFFGSRGDALAGGGSTVRDFGPRYEQPDEDNISDGMEAQPANRTVGGVAGDSTSAAGTSEPVTPADDGGDAAATDSEESTQVQLPPA